MFISPGGSFEKFPRKLFPENSKKKTRKNKNKTKTKT
jgi:hypothetical protein